MGTQDAYSIKSQGGKSMMDRMVWLLCPVCGNKTRLKVRQDTELIHELQYCQKRKQDVLYLDQPYLFVICMSVAFVMQ